MENHSAVTLKNDMNYFKRQPQFRLEITRCKFIQSRHPSITLYIEVMSNIWRVSIQVNLERSAKRSIYIGDHSPIPPNHDMLSESVAKRHWNYQPVIVHIKIRSTLGVVWQAKCKF